MTIKKRFGLSTTALIVLLVLFSGWMATGKRPPEAQPSAFAAAVDLTGLADVAVHTEGRLKSLASFANGMMDFVTGPRRYQGQSRVFTYFDLMLRPEEYRDADVIFVKNKALRADIVDALRGSGVADRNHPRYDPRLGDRIEAFMKWGLISESLLVEPKVSARLTTARSDLIRSAKFVEAIDSALAVKNPSLLADRLRVIPVPGADEMEPWSSVFELRAGSRLSEAMDDELFGELSGAWLAFQQGWMDQDPEAVNSAAATLATTLPLVNEAVYPSATRLQWESRYFDLKGLTWDWMIYLVAVILLLLSVVYGWRGASLGGVAVFLVAFGIQTFALGLRWYVSGRWPNSNMFEAVTTSAWMGGAAALLFALFGKRTVLRNLFLLTSAVASMVALMSAHFLPLQLNPNISNRMPVLHDVWLYIHTNVIIWSYILIFMAAVSGMLYLVHRMVGGAPVFASAGGSMFGLGGVRAALAGGGAAGGAAGGDGGEGAGQEGDSDNAGLGRVLDGVTMDLMKLSFVMLWAGLVMGAIWADHSWGRPWGWDPKEVFALNTFLIFAVLVHARFKARDKGLWTALLAVVGAGVMLFNWIVINFAITGLHSYA